MATVVQAQAHRTGSDAGQSKERKVKFCSLKPQVLQKDFFLLSSIW